MNHQTNLITPTRVVKHVWKYLDTVTTVTISYCIGFPPRGRALAVASVCCDDIDITPVPIRARYQIGITCWTLSKYNTAGKFRNNKDDKRRA